MTGSDQEGESASGLFGSHGEFVHLRTRANLERSDRPSNADRLSGPPTDGLAVASSDLSASDLFILFQGVLGARDES